MYDLSCMLMVNRGPSWYSMDYRVYMGSSMTVRPLASCYCTCALINQTLLAASEARWETDQAYVALGNLHTQMEQVDQQKAITQAASADVQAVLAGLQEQLETARTEALTAMHQRIQANNRAGLAEVA